MQLAFDNIGLGSLTKTDMCSKLFDQLGVNKREASDMVDTFFSIISDRLATGEDVRLADFASFQVKTKSSRPGRNPRTGEAVQIASRKVVTFIPGPKLKNKLNPTVKNA